MELVACGPWSDPPPDIPFVPDLVVLRDGDVLLMCDRESREPMDEAGLQAGLAAGKLLKFGSSPWEDGMWVSVEKDGGTKRFFLSDEKRWREARAKSLINDANAVVGDPVLKLELLSAAGAMGKLDVPKLVSTLEGSRKSKSESLMDIYLRLEEAQKKP